MRVRGCSPPGARAQGELLLESWPLHLGALFAERLMAKACYEDDDYGGLLDFQKDSVDVLLMHFGRRLNFVEALHDLIFCNTLAQQYRRLQDPELLTLLCEETLELPPDAIGCPALRTRAADVLMLNVQKYRHPLHTFVSRA